MSKSLARVRRTLEEAGLDTEILEMPGGTGSAEEAAMAAGRDLDQTVKSIVFRGEADGHVVLFPTAGGNRVDAGKASMLAGEPLGKADAALIRAETGFAIGGVAPIGHLGAIPAWFDPRLPDFDIVWAAAGPPRHVFAAAPQAIQRLSAAQVADVTG